MMFFCVMIFPFKSQLFAQQKQDENKTEVKENQNFKNKDINRKYIITIGNMFKYSTGSYVEKEVNHDVTFLSFPSLEFQYVIIKGFATGLHFNFNHSDIEYNYLNKNDKFWAIGVGPSIFYYFRLNRRIIPFLGFNYDSI